MSIARAQAGLEYILVVGLMFLVMIPFFYYATHESTDRIRLSQAEDAVKSVARTAENMNALGPGSKDTIWVTIPNGVSGQYVNESEILLSLDFAGSSTEVVEFVKAKVAGSMPTNSGTHRILVQTLASGVVQIGEYNDSAAPLVVFTSPSGVISYSAVTLLANTNEPADCAYDLEDKEYSGMGSSFSGVLLNHQNYLGILGEGDYLFFVRCQDKAGNTMGNSALINFTVILQQAGNESNQTYEANPPNVTLLNPPEGHIDTDGIALFGFTVSDESPIPLCTLLFNSSIQSFFINISTAQANNKTAAGLDFGDYQWSVSCTDIYNNVGNSTSRRIFINFTQDKDLPVVYLEGPADGLVRNYWLIKFSYNTSDMTSGIDYCSLNLNGVTDANGTLDWSVISTPVVEGQSQTITVPLLKANYSWYISCVDDSQKENVGVSESRTFIINVTAGEQAFIDSCAGWCGWQGLSTGTCENNIPKCANNCDLPYSPTNDCYAGSAVSAQHCTGGSESDTCCCTV